MSHSLEPKRSSSGGFIYYTSRGLIHRAERRYSGNFDEKRTEAGRPEKDQVRFTSELRFPG